MITFEQTEAIYKLYPEVVRTDGDVAYDANDNEISYDLAAVNQKAKTEFCKEKAKALIAATDWAVLPDVGLANQDAFVFYRLNLRNLIKNPVADPVFETEPTPIWS